MTPRFLRIALLTSILDIFLLTAALPAQELVLRAEFWAESEPVPSRPAAETGPIAPDDVAEALLSEARQVFSAMIWGFEFIYVPYDKARAVPEELNLSPLGAIPWGDPRLTLAETRSSGTQLRAYLEYRPDAHGISRRKAWETSPYESAQGQGAAPLSEGPEARFKAMDEAAKEALRALLRPVVKNKPREIRGMFAYAAAPRLVVSGGKYVAILRIRVHVTEVRAYSAY